MRDIPEQLAPTPLDEISLLLSHDEVAVLTPAEPIRRQKSAASSTPLPGSGVARSASSLADAYNDIDWAWVEELRIQAANQLSKSIRRDDSEEETVLQAMATRSGARTEARPLVTDMVEESIQDRLRLGTLATSQVNQTQLVEAVLDSLFGMGRLQPLLDRSDVENIEFLAYDRVVIEFSDGHLEDGPQIFFSDEEMRSYITFIASRDGGRAFSPARPNLDLKLQGGERLSATSWVSAATYMTIRKHRLTDIELSDLVARDECTPLAAGYLAAMVKAKRSIVVAGSQGAGKTTLLRALCRQIDPDDAIGTFETEFELGLHEIPSYRRVKAFEARPGSGERGVGGRQAGEITVDDLLYNSFRMNLDRQIVGEVRGREVLAMIKAMQSGSGSLSTTHSADAEGAVDKLITCALEAGPHVTLDYATRAVSGGIHLIVYVSRADVLVDGVPTRLRYISEISEVVPNMDSPKGFSCTEIFTTTEDSPFVAVPMNPSHFAGKLDSNLFDQQMFMSLAPITPVNKGRA